VTWCTCATWTPDSASSRSVGLAGMTTGKKLLRAPSPSSAPDTLSSALPLLSCTERQSMLSRSQGAVLMQVHWTRSLTHMPLRTETSATKYGNRQCACGGANAQIGSCIVHAGLVMWHCDITFRAPLGKSPCQKLDLGGGDQSKMTERSHQGCQVPWEFGPCWE